MYAHHICLVYKGKVNLILFATVLTIGSDDY